jgi:hypothetical protein
MKEFGFDYLLEQVTSGARVSASMWRTLIVGLGDDEKLRLADMARAILTGRDFRASYKQTLHVLEIMTGFEKASDKNGYIELTTHFDRVQPMYNNPIHGILD